MALSDFFGITSIIAGAATLVTKGSWMVNELEDISAGVTFEDNSHS